MARTYPKAPRPALVRIYIRRNSKPATARSAYHVAAWTRQRFGSLHCFRSEHSRPGRTPRRWSSDRQLMLHTCREGRKYNFSKISRELKRVLARRETEYKEAFLLRRKDADDKLRAACTRRVHENALAAKDVEIQRLKDMWCFGTCTSK